MSSSNCCSWPAYRFLKMRVRYSVIPVSLRTLQTNIAVMSGVLTVYVAHGFCPGSWWPVLSQSTVLRLQVALQGNSPKQSLCFVYVPDVSFSGSGSWVLCKDTDSLVHAFCTLPRSEQLSWPGAWRVQCPRWAVHLNHLPGPGHLVPWVRFKNAVSGVPCVSSGELISGCDPPGRCQTSRIPGRRGYQQGAYSHFDGGCCLWGWDCPPPSGSGCWPPPGGEGPVHSC